MKRSLVGRMIFGGALTVCAVSLGSVVRSAQFAGPGTTQSSYLLPSRPVVTTTSLLTVGDDVGGYRLVGIPDGMGALDNGDGTFTVLLNHELGNTAGVIRAHGGKGAFVSKWTIDRKTLTVLSGSDLIQKVFLWNKNTQQSDSFSSFVAFNRFCSADLPAPTAFYDPATGLGSRARIFLNGEEGGSTGYQVATVVTGPEAGTAYVLGKFNLATNGTVGGTAVGASENTLASPYPQDKTVVISTNDGGTGIMTNAVSVYVGTKQATGTEVEKAGLMNGTLKFVNVAGVAMEIVDTPANPNPNHLTAITSGMRFSLSASSSTTFSRPEDGAWDPSHPNRFYFVTTDRLDQAKDGVGAQVGQTRLWRLNFDDITNPDAGGTIDLLIDGRVVNGEKVNMFDNLTINETSGVVVLVEDVGNAAHNGKTWVYDPATDALTRVAHHDPARFGDIGKAATAPFNQDEEASGILDVSSILGPGYYLVVTQAHYAIPGELVEGGQLQLLRLPFPVAADKDRCKSGGWSGQFRGDGSVFKNQGDCVQYVNTGK